MEWISANPNLTVDQILKDTSNINFYYLSKNEFRKNKIVSEKYKKKVKFCIFYFQIKEYIVILFL